ncbi:MAG TPA: 2-amino-4-hydroxy-6-hydroxymethyldihydropteridine diphosphokinase [Thermomicrobiales bacterium]|nr:2-amino-4-hydroxy-6-hydroxymethyldihydropteridine diphosphokinase [Thermomicrobiales bacterium]
MATAYIGLGANLGDRLATLRTAVQRLEILGRITGISRLYETEPVGYLEQPPFLNAVVALETELAPGELLGALLGIERGLGRERSFRNAPRTLDLDLLLVDDLVLNTPEATLPHPRLHERAFVLVPLAELAPAMVHPGSGLTVGELARALPDAGGVEVYAPAGWETTPTRSG